MRRAAIDLDKCLEVSRPVEHDAAFPQRTASAQLNLLAAQAPAAPRDRHGKRAPRSVNWVRVTLQLKRR
jgi:hypothetical protein